MCRRFFGGDGGNQYKRLDEITAEGQRALDAAQAVDLDTQPDGNIENDLDVHEQIDQILGSDRDE